MSRVITIDGPSGAGKGTVSRVLSNTLGYALLDSGAIYRLAALSALQRRIDFSNEAALTEMAAELNIEFVAGPTETKVKLNGQDVSLEIREEETGLAASRIAPITSVRAALLDRQRDFAQSGVGLVADGRDMGTVVFPNAFKKFYLTASAEERARRRVLQLESSSGDRQSYETILKDIQSRDERDMNRKTAPLKPAEDAIIIDSTSIGIGEVVNFMLQHINEC